MSINILSPYQNFVGLDGKPLTGGAVYIGAVNQDPTVNPVAVFWDEAMTIPAAQPLPTNAGYIVRNGTPSRVYVASDYSISVRDSSNVLVYYLAAAGGKNYPSTDDLAAGGAALIGGNTQVVANVAALRALLKTSPSKFARTIGYYGSADGGGATYYLDVADTTSLDNGGTVIVATDGGRWKTSTISTATFGCAPANTVADNSARLIKCIDAALAAGQTIIDVAQTFAVDDVAYPIRNKSRVFFRGAQITGMYRRASMAADPVSNVRVFRQVEDDALIQFSSVINPVVVMMGDSISGPSISGAAPNDSTYEAICNEISRKNPGIAVQFYNRAIGGAVWANANGIGNAYPAWYTNQSQPWLTYVQNLAPDLLFLGFGMNDSSGFDAASMHAVVDKIKLWPKVPSIVFITTPQPSMATTYGGGSSYYDRAGQEGRDYVAGYTRAFATRKGYGLLDVNRQFNLLRDGRDILACPLGQQVVQAGTYALASKPCHEFYFKGQVGTWPDGGIVRIMIGPNPNDWVECVKSGTALNITANSAGEPSYFVQNVTLPSTTLLELNVAVSATTVIIGTDDFTELARFNCLRHGGEFTPRISYRTAPTSGPFTTYILSLGSPLLVQQTLTDDMIYGPPNAGATENSPFGGNGVNHYSAEGLNYVVRPVVESLNLEQRAAPLFSGIIPPDATGIVVQKDLKAYRNGNIVHMAGSASVASAAVDKTIFTLPVGFRPSAQILICGTKLVSGNWTPCVIRIAATGDVHLFDVAAASSVELNISFVIA